MKIGIGVTTRNRYKSLSWVLSRLDIHRSPGHDYTVVVYDDNSKSNTEDLCRQNYRGELMHAYAKRQSGITAGKNYCLSRLKGCDYVFLIDDDCFPKKAGWEDCFIRAADLSGDNVLIYTKQGALRSHKVVRKGNGVNYFNEGAGCLVFVTAKALSVLGGYNPDYSFYGHEHNGYCVRAKRAGLNRGEYVCPVDATDYIHSLDIDGSGKFRAMVGEFKSILPLDVRQYHLMKGRYAWDQDVTGKLQYYEI